MRIIFNEDLDKCIRTMDKQRPHVCRKFVCTMDKQRHHVCRRCVCIECMDGIVCERSKSHQLVT